MWGREVLIRQVHENHQPNFRVKTDWTSKLTTCSGWAAADAGKSPPPPSFNICFSRLVPE